MNDHDGPGVIPGFYPGEPLRVHDGPTPQAIANEQQRQRADALAGKICATAADAARSQYLLLELLGEFDAIGAIRYWNDFKSLAHWLSWSCSMTPGVAREHVRVAKALRRMPTIADLFQQGRLSYSKVREVTRVVDVVDEERLAGLALTATASQLARMIAGFRSADGMRIKQQNKRSLSWQERENGMIDVRARLPKEEAAVLLAALEAARDQFGPPPPAADPAGEPCQTAAGVGVYSNADALLDVARGFLATAPEDRSGEDRTLVVVHVSAENLARNAPAGTLSAAAEPAAAAPEPVKLPAEDVPERMEMQTDSIETGRPDLEGAECSAETSEPPAAICQIEGVGSLEAATAQKLACDNPLLGAIVDKHGKVLALGRSRRLVSRALRRALMIRDGMCQYPGCHQTRHLKAHHRVPWILGGRTDLHNLILLCQWHHTVVPEGQVTISEGSNGWLFCKPDGQPCQPWVSDHNLAQHLDFAIRRRNQQAQRDKLASVNSFQHADARTIRPRWAGEPFDLHACVQALFTIKLREPKADLDQQAA